MHTEQIKRNQRIKECKHHQKINDQKDIDWLLCYVASI
jgi:hypothetical protein